MKLWFLTHSSLKAMLTTPENRNWVDVISSSTPNNHPKLMIFISCLFFLIFLLSFEADVRIFKYLRINCISIFPGTFIIIRWKRYRVKKMWKMAKFSYSVTKIRKITGKLNVTLHSSAFVTVWVYISWQYASVVVFLSHAFLYSFTCYMWPDCALSSHLLYHCYHTGQQVTSLCSPFYHCSLTNWHVNSLQMVLLCISLYCASSWFILPHFCFI